MATTAWCWPQSVLPGESVSVFGCEGEVEVEVVRDGAAPSVVGGGVGVDVVSSDVPGVHLVRTRSAGASGWDPVTAFFVVRSPSPVGRGLLLVLSTNTWNAYNDHGGANLYTGAVELRYDRPQAPGMLAKPSDPGERVVDLGAYLRYTAAHELTPWHAMAGWAGQERRFVVWAESLGLELGYAVDNDLADVDGLLSGQRLVLSVGHDEYWTAEMRDSVESFRDAGGNVAFFSGNTCYWQVRVTDEGRNMVAWKHRVAEDPEQGARSTTMWADTVLDRPEAALTGVTFTRGGYHRVAQSVPGGSGAYEVHRPDHWLLEGTGLRRGDLLGVDAGPVGYECDGCDLALVDGLPVATGFGGTPAGFEVVATAPATSFDAATTPLPLPEGGRYELEWHAERLLGSASAENQAKLRHGHAVLGCYSVAGGGTVVTVGCTDWAWALEKDPAVDRVTRNVLDRLAPEVDG